jgi:hypothetical protein
MKDDLFLLAVRAISLCGALATSAVSKTEPDADAAQLVATQVVTAVGARRPARHDAPQQPRVPKVAWSE